MPSISMCDAVDFNIVLYDRKVRDAGVPRLRESQKIIITTIMTAIEMLITLPLQGAVGGLIELIPPVEVWRKFSTWKRLHDRTRSRE